MENYILNHGSNYEEIYFEKSNLSILAYFNGIIQIDQIIPTPRTDYIKIVSSGEVEVISDADWKDPIKISNKDRAYASDNKIFVTISTYPSKLNIKIYKNKVVQIEQSEPKHRIDFIELDSSGNIKVIPEGDYKGRIKIGQLSERRKVGN